MRLTSLSLALAAAAALSVPAYAHHSFAMFDNTKLTTWEGTVERYDWTNPHTQIFIVVPPSAKDQSTVGRWNIEGSSPNIMTRQGWNKSTLKPGDKVTLVGHPLRQSSL